MIRRVALVAGLLLSVQAGPALACRGPVFHRYYLLNAPPESVPPDSVVLEVAARRLPPDRYRYAEFQARVHRVIQGRFRGSVVTIAPQAGSSCTYLSEWPAGPKAWVVGELVRGPDGVPRLRPRAMRARPRSF